MASVILAHSLLLSLPAVQPGETFLTGISWGGYLACIVAGLDNRFRGVAPVYGCGYLSESDGFRSPFASLSEAEQKSWNRFYDPSVYLPFAAMPVLFVNGNKDKFFDVVSYHKSYRLVPSAQRWLSIKANMSHGHVAGWAPAEIKRFFDYLREAGPPIPAVKLQGDADSTFLFAVSGNIKEARFYYTNQKDVPNERREWQFVPVNLEGKTEMLTVRKPSNGFGIAFLQVEDSLHFSASSEFIFR